MTTPNSWRAGRNARASAALASQETTLRAPSRETDEMVSGATDGAGEIEPTHLEQVLPAALLDAGVEIGASGGEGGGANSETEAKDPPVTILVSRRIKPGREELFAEQLVALRELLEKREGFVDIKAYEPSCAEDEHKVVISFDAASSLQAWQDSHERRQWVQSVKPLEARPARAQVLTGIETWFTLPTQEGMAPPPRHKMAIVTWLGVFPLVSLVNLFLVPQLDPLPPLSKSAVTSILLVALMTYVIMPRMTRVCACFLYPEIDLKADKD